MAFADPGKFDHDNDGHAGGSLAKGVEMGGKPVNVEVPAEDVAEAPVHGLAADDPAVTGIPRDERADSVDPQTGTLTEEAQDLRRQAATDTAE